MSQSKKRYRVMQGYCVRIGDGHQEVVYNGGEVFEAEPQVVGYRKNDKGEPVPITRTIEQMYASRVEVDTGRTKKGADGKPETVWQRVVDREAKARCKANKPLHAERGRKIREREDKQHEERQKRSEAVRSQGRSQAEAGAKHRMVESPVGG